MNNLYITEPDHNLIVSAIQLIQNNYDRDAVIYATRKFCDAITNPLEQSLPDESWSGFIGRYRGVPVYCIKKEVSNDSWAIVLPQYNFDVGESENG